MTMKRATVDAQHPRGGRLVSPGSLKRPQDSTLHHLLQQQNLIPLSGLSRPFLCPSGRTQRRPLSGA